MPTQQEVQAMLPVRGGGIDLRTCIDTSRSLIPTAGPSPDPRNAPQVHQVEEWGLRWLATLSRENAADRVFGIKHVPPRSTRARYRLAVVLPYGGPDAKYALVPPTSGPGFYIGERQGDAYPDGFRLYQVWPVAVWVQVVRERLVTHLAPAKVDAELARVITEFALGS